MKIKVGTPVVVRRGINLELLQISVAPGETGIVTDVDPENGDLMVHLDRHHPELDDWRNLFPINARLRKSVRATGARGVKAKPCEEIMKLIVAHKCTLRREDARALGRFLLDL